MLVGDRRANETGCGFSGLHDVDMAVLGITRKLDTGSLRAKRVVAKIGRRMSCEERQILYPDTKLNAHRSADGSGRGTAGEPQKNNGAAPGEGQRSQ